MTLKILSVFSGCGAFELPAARSPHLETIAVAEIDPYASAVLAHHFPGVQNLGDVTQIDGTPFRGKVDILVGGSPCQNFSKNAAAAGASATGIRGDQSRLLLDQIRIAYECEAKYFVWENVLGAIEGKGKADFAAVLGLLRECGYGLAYRVLYAPDFGLAQTRDRVFVVGFLGGDSDRPSRVLSLNRSFGRVNPADHPKYRAKSAHDCISSGVFAFNACRSCDTTQFERCPTLLASKSRKRHESTGANMAIWRDGKFRRVGCHEKLALQGFPRDWLDIPALPSNLNRFKHQMAALSIPVPFCEFVFDGILRESGVGRDILVSA